MSNPRQESTPERRRADASHFSPLANLRTPEYAIPPCAYCGGRSLGAFVVGMGPSGNIFDLSFDCGQHGETIFPVMSSALYPAYRVVSDDGKGRLRVQRLTREEMLQRVQPHGPA